MSSAASHMFSDESTPGAPARRSPALDLLRVAAVCGVVVIHATRPMTLTRSGPGWELSAALDMAFIWAVPVFVMISGALVLEPDQHAAGPMAFYRRRFARILPALIFWHVIYLSVVRWGIEERPVSGGELAQMALRGDFYGALWFFWVIVGLYLVAPVVAPFLNAGETSPDGSSQRGVALGWCLVLLTATIYALPGLAALLGTPSIAPRGLTSPTLLTQWWPFLGLFVLGFAYRGIRSPRRTGFALLAVGGLLVAEVAWQVLTGGGRLLAAVSPISYHSITTMLAAVCIFVGVHLAWRPTRPASTLAVLSDAAFGVFLVHQLVLAVLGRWLLAPTSFVACVALATATIPLAFAISLGARQVPGLRRVF